MATYAVGDIQGCYHAFQALLKRINFDPKFDQLWLVGDLINRGSGVALIWYVVSMFTIWHH